MTFTRQMFEPTSSPPPAVPPAPPDLKALPGSDWHPDPSVRDLRGFAGGNGPDVVMGSTSPDRLLAAQGRFGPEPVTEMAVPAVTKAGTSGTPGELAPLRYESRPGQNRHPSSGQFTRGESIAAGHPTLDQQPRPLRGGGPFAAQTPAPMVRPPRDPDACSSISVALERHATSVGRSRLDLSEVQGPQWSAQLAHPVNPDLSQLAPQASQTDRVNPRPALGSPAAIPAPPGSPEWGGGPLARAITAHSSGPVAFGMTPSAATCPAPGE